MTKKSEAHQSYEDNELLQISRDMRSLYNAMSGGTIEREDADSRANVAGKNLKAIQILTARQIFMSNQIIRIDKLESRTNPELPNTSQAQAMLEGRS